LNLFGLLTPWRATELWQFSGPGRSPTYPKGYVMQFGFGGWLY